MVTASMPNLFTRDVDAAVAYYRDQLGFTQAYQVPGQGRPEHVVPQLGPSRLALSTTRAVLASGLDPAADNAFELVVWCPDVDAEAARQRAHGATVLAEPYDHLAGHRRAYLADPDGNWLALVDAR